MPRPVDAELDRALASAPFVLVVGDSATGKSRAAYEAMRRHFADRQLIVPTGPTSLATLPDADLAAGVELRDALVWLNDLDVYLGQDGLTSTVYHRLIGRGDRRVSLLATMRASTYADYFRPIPHQATVARAAEGAARPRSDPKVDLDLRSGRELLEQHAIRLDLGHRLTAAELAHARQGTWDPRIEHALEHLDACGFAEQLAGAL